MNKIILFFLFNGVVFGNGLNPHLMQELSEMCEKDQQVRLLVIDGKKSDVSIGEIDREHLPRLKSIVEEFGWPGVSLIGEKGMGDLWLLTQHCDEDVEFQKRCLELLREAVGNSEAPKKHMAYLTDRVLVNEGKPQIYGTQAQIVEGRIESWPIQDEEHLEARREEMGLGSVTEYLAALKDVYHTDN